MINKMILIAILGLSLSGCKNDQAHSHMGEEEIKSQRTEAKIRPVYKLVDTCAAEFKASTPYYYSTYETECEARVSSRKKVMILGGGPNRIGQGIEFDYCCVHAAHACRDPLLIQPIDSSRVVAT